MTKSHFKVATANAHEARLLKHPEGLKPFEHAGVDVLLLQEVLGMDNYTLGEALDRYDYEALHVSHEYGLAIAARKNGPVHIDTVDTNDTMLHKPSGVEAFLKTVTPSSNRMRARGLIGSQVWIENAPVTLATTHPIVFVRALARAKQVQALSDALKSDFYNTPAMILGADMNHFPSPRAIDLRAQVKARLLRVETDRPSWEIEGSRHEWLARMAAFIMQREVQDFSADLDALLYRGVREIGSAVIDIESDHRAIITEFEF